MKKLLIVVVIWGLILGGGAAAYYYLFQGKADDPKVADGGDKDKDKNTGPHKKLKLALDSFSGYCIFRSDEFKKKLAAQDYDFEWVDDKADYPARMKSVQAGETPLAVFTIDALLNTTPRSGDPPATIIMVIDETRGADAMIGLDPGMKDVEGLNRKDAKIVLVEDSPSETLSRVVRSQFKLPDLPLLKSDYLIPAKGADINDVYEQFLSAAPTEHKAFVLWEPYVSLALKRKGARVLVDSSQFKGYIVDVLAAQTAWLRDHPADAQAVVRTYLEQLHGLQQTDGAMAALVLSDAHRVGENKVGPDEAATMVGKIWWKNTMENYAQMGVLPATNAATGLQTLDEMIHNITTVLDQTKQPGEPSPGVARPDKLYDNSVLGALYAERPAFMIGAETVRVDAAAPRAERRGLEQAAARRPVPGGRDPVQEKWGGVLRIRRRADEAGDGGRKDAPVAAVLPPGGGQHARRRHPRESAAGAGSGERGQGLSGAGPGRGPGTAYPRGGQHAGQRLGRGFRDAATLRPGRRMMGQPAPRGFVHLLLSAQTLVPVVLGLGAALAVWGFRVGGDAGTRLAIFLAVAGALGGVGTLLTQMVLGAKTADPAVTKKRRELLACLDALADGVQRPAAAEPDFATAPAPIERA